MLKPEELELLMRSEHRPNVVIHVLGEIVRQAKLPDSEIHRMDESVTFFADSIGGCERLLTTPIPLSYTRYFRLDSPPPPPPAGPLAGPKPHQYMQANATEVPEKKVAGLLGLLADLQQSKAAIAQGQKLMVSQSVWAAAETPGSNAFETARP